MPEQLDLFSITIAGENEPEVETPVVKQERVLKPPATVIQEAPVETKSRALLKDEALKIARGNVAVQVPQPRPQQETEKPSTITTVAVPDVKISPIVEPIAVIAVKSKDETAKPKTRGRKSIKEMSMEADLPEIPEDEILFGKQYYGIGEVASMFKVNTSLLRYWESEFDILKPRKNGKGDRFFRPDDIKNLQIIHHLLRQKKFTIEGAKEYLKNNKKSKENFEMIRQLEQLKRFLLEMKAGL
jgi:DNA-binding transcriptional MerR regulator